jgi:hypothetical protein
MIPSPDSPEPKPQRRLRRAIWLAIVLSLLLLIFTPFIEYLTTIVKTFENYGFVTPVAQKVWGNRLKNMARYFTGPPKDAEIIAYFERNRADLDLLMKMYHQDGGRHPPPSLEPRPEYMELGRKLGVFMMVGGEIPDSIYNDRSKKDMDLIEAKLGRQFAYHKGRDVITMELPGFKPEWWWKSSYTWRKFIQFIPPSRSLIEQSRTSTKKVCDGRIFDTNLEKLEDNNNAFHECCQIDGPWHLCVYVGTGKK